MTNHKQFIVQRKFSDGRPAYFSRWIGREQPEWDAERSKAKVFKILVRAQLFAMKFGGRVVELRQEPTPAERQAAILREALAELAHTQWSEWMEYLFSKSGFNPDGTSTIPAALVERWRRQLSTPYAELPEHEKRLDRVEADRMLAVSRDYITKLEVVRDRARALLRNPAPSANAQPLYDAVQASLEVPTDKDLDTECALCYHLGPCQFDGEAYICVDETNCQERRLARFDSAIDTNPEPPIGPQMPPDDWL